VWGDLDKIVNLGKNCKRSPLLRTCTINPLLPASHQASAATPTAADACFPRPPHCSMKKIRRSVDHLRHLRRMDFNGEMRIS